LQNRLKIRDPLQTGPGGPFPIQAWIKILGGKVAKLEFIDDGGGTVVM